MTSFFILGSHPHLSRAELASQISLSPVLAADDALLADVEEVNFSQLQANLGGMIKMGTIHAVASNQEEIVDTLIGLAYTLRPELGRVQFGISVYSGGHSGKLAALRAGTEKIALTVKNRLKESGRSARWVSSLTPVLSSVVVTKQKLIYDGIEFCLFPTIDKIYIGVTESVQDFENWSHRDYDRPSRDALRGMLPPKLARLMVNLAQGDPQKDVILDPYCGVGTVLTEAIALGYTNLVGSDIDEKACEATRMNIDWEVKDRGVEVTPKIINASAETVASFLAPKSINIVVAEVYLGKPRTGEETRIELEQQMKSLTEMYMEGLRGLSHLVAQGASVVLAFPAYAIHGGFVEADIVKRAQLFGFELEPFEEVETTKQGALRYGRERQLVWRDIYRFKRV